MVSKIYTELFIKNLEKLSKCKGLSKDDLNGRYKNSYNRLKRDLKIFAEAYLTEITMETFRWEDLKNEIGLEATLKVAEEINDFSHNVNEGKAIMKEISRAIYKECSFEAFKEACNKMLEQEKHIIWKYAPKEWESIERTER